MQEPNALLTTFRGPVIPPMDEAKDIIANMIMVSEKARREGPDVYGEEWYRTTMDRGGKFISDGNAPDGA
jgi:hypothetical protein